MVAFTVDTKPIGTNSTYRRGKGRGFYKTDHAKVFFARIQMHARRAMRGARPLEGSLQAAITFHFDSERPDVDGPIKPVLDALEGIVYTNDRQVRRLIVERALDRERPRVEIAITEVTP